MMASVQLNLRIEKKKKTHYQQLAAADGRSLSNWIIHTLDRINPDSTKRQGGKPR